MNIKINDYCPYLHLILISIACFFLIVSLAICINPEFKTYPMWCQYLIVGLFLFILIWISLLFFSTAESIKKKYSTKSGAIVGYLFVILSQLSVFLVAWLTKDLDASPKNFAFLFFVTVFLSGTVHYWFGDKVLKSLRISS